MTLDRRAFVRWGAGGAMAGLLSLALGEDKPKSGIKLGVSFTPRPTDDDLAMLRHAGVDAVSIWTGIEDATFEWMMQTKRRLDAQGVEVYNIGILDLHCDPTIVLGLDGVETKIEQYKTYLTNLGRAGIHYTTYAHMANIKVQKVPGYYQTAITTTRGGAPTREFDLEVARRLPLSHGKTYTDDHIWKTFTTFIRAVMPVAEKAGVRIGLHPDDPPVDTLGGVARIFRNAAGFERALKIAGSENFGICLCVGTWGEGGKMMGRDPVEMILLFGPRKRIFKVHFRNVDRPLPKFRETFVDNGYLDMYQVMRALREANFGGIVIPDHVPGGGYQGVNTSYTLGYMKALRDRVNAEAGAKA
ncbi:MAG: mannonate dehydratase [Acidobacteria bacterium]|nr:mannonate dehydratase [Acidobacteriota bacterium]